MRRTPALILGGGPAGSAAAIALAAGGIIPLLIERQAETGDALCGGFLSWRTLAALGRLGVDADALGGAPVSRVRVFAGARSVEARLPGRAIGLSRRALDSALLARAEAAGTQVERGVTVRETSVDEAELADGTRIAGDALFLATGKHELRGLARPRDAAGGDPALGLRLRLESGASKLVAGAIELHLFDRGYAGIVVQEDGRANLCLAVRKSRLAEAGGSPDALLRALGNESPALGERLAWMSAEPAIDAIASIPYGWRARDTAPGLFRLGDQAAVIPSLAGEGIGLALASGARAARAFLDGGPSAAPAYQRAFADAARRPLAVAGLLWRIGENPTFARPVLSALRLAPTLLRLAARLTRIA